LAIGFLKNPCALMDGDLPAVAVLLLIIGGVCFMIYCVWRKDKNDRGPKSGHGGHLPEEKRKINFFWWLPIGKRPRKPVPQN